eukprot:403369142
MSQGLGWTTQSSFLPKESKKINVAQNSSLVDLKAKIIEEKAKLFNKTSTNPNEIPQQYQKRKDLFQGGMKQLQNKGIDERMKRDEHENDKNRVEFDDGEIDNRKVQSILSEKAQIYEQLIHDKQAHLKGKSHLIDYEQKRWDHEDKNQSKDKSQHNHDYLSDMNTLNDIMARERKAWEQEARREINHVEKGGSLGSLTSNIKDSATAMLGDSLAPLVKQRWDNILTSKEKDFLPEVIRDKERQQEMLLLAKRKRETEKESRLAKIEEMKKRRRAD